MERQMHPTLASSVKIRISLYWESSYQTPEVLTCKDNVDAHRLKKMGILKEVTQCNA